jgi:hypothetical protein
MVFKCNICNRDFVSEESLKQHNEIKHRVEEKKAKINMRKYIILSLILLIILFSIITVSSYAKKPGKYDEFAKCLTEKGAIIYGNDYCSYTINQLSFFGKSKKYLNYVKCAYNERLCNEKEIEITPTWEIKGEMYLQVQTFERLSALSGCEI